MVVTLMIEASAALAGGSASPTPAPTLPAQYFSQPCDHFNAASWNCTFQQKYYIDDHAWESGQNPTAMITFIPGGESAMGGMYNYAILRDLAYSRHGIALTMEHRFWGDSIPFGANQSSFRGQHVGLLTVEQCMADYAALIEHVRAQYKCPHCPVVAGGGSYSGKLAAYMRLKYPSVVDMALAASAPVFLDSLGFGIDFDYYRIVTEATAKISPQCPDAVRAAIATVFASNAATLTRGLNLCDPLPTSFSDGKLELLQRVMNQFADTAMGNYPPSRSPIAVECAALLSAPRGSLAALALFLNDRYKWSVEDGALLEAPRESGACYNVSSAAAAGAHGRVVCSDWSGCGYGLNAEAWDLEACTEIVQPLSTNNVTDMFWPRNYTLAWATSHCLKRFNAKPLRSGRHTAFAMGLDALRAGESAGYSRVIFSNGDQDPWSAGGVLDDIGADIIAIRMVNGSHHVDLRPADVDDTPDVLAARKREVAILSEWLAAAARERRARFGGRAPPPGEL
jgi:pimeloyl-ACP methyl ester carboxylesterase